MNRICYLFVLLVLPSFIISMLLEHVYAWEAQLSGCQVVFESTDECLRGDILDVDPQRRSVFFQTSGGKWWLSLAPQATVTRNGIPAPMESLQPIGKNVYQEAYLSIDGSGLVRSVSAWYCAVPVRIVGLHGQPAHLADLELLNFDGSTCVLPGRALPSEPANSRMNSTKVIAVKVSHTFEVPSPCDNQEGLAILSRNLELRYFIPYE